MDAMDALDAMDAVGERNVQLVRRVGSGQWDGATPCTEWNVRSLVGHLITGRHVCRGFLEGVPVAELMLMLQRQGEAVGDDPAAACESAVRSIRAAFAQPGALERTVRHTVGDMAGRQLPVQLAADCVVHSRDLAAAIGVDPGRDEQLIELSYEFCVPLMQNDAVYAYGWFRPPASPLPAGATALSGSCISWAADSLSADSHQRTGRLGCPGCRGRGSLAPAESARPFSQLAESTKPDRSSSPASDWPAGIPG
jgi:uncharacterized protein (TIGR03086 family)